MLKHIFGKLFDWASDWLSKNWKWLVTAIFSVIETFLVWFENLPNAEKFPLILSVPAILFIPYTCYQLGKEKWLLSERVRAIKHGAGIVFENKDNQWVINVIKDWAGSSTEPDVFSEEKNYQRIKSDYESPVKQLITLTHSNASEQNKVDPVLYMTISKTEFIRWLTDNHDLPIPTIWFARKY